MLLLGRFGKAIQLYKCPVKPQGPLLANGFASLSSLERINHTTMAGSGSELKHPVRMLLT